AQSPGFRQPYVLLETKLHEISEYTLICKLIWFFRETHLGIWASACEPLKPGSNSLICILFIKTEYPSSLRTRLPELFWISIDCCSNSSDSTNSIIDLTFQETQSGFTGKHTTRMPPPSCVTTIPSQRTLDAPESPILNKQTYAPIYQLARAMRSYLSPQIIGERNCGSYNQCTTSTRFLQLTMMMMMIHRSAIRPFTCSDTMILGLWMLGMPTIEPETQVNLSPIFFNGMCSHNGRLIFHLIFEISRYIFIKETIHKVAENASTVHDRFRSSWGSSEERSAVAPFRCLTAMPPEGSTRARILPGCASLDRGIRVAEVGFEPPTFRSVNSRSNHLGTTIHNMTRLQAIVCSHCDLFFLWFPDILLRVAETASTTHDRFHHSALGSSGRRPLRVPVNFMFYLKRNCTKLANIHSFNLVFERITLHPAEIQLGVSVPVGLVKDDISFWSEKARAAFVNPRHRWRRHDISFSVNGRVYNAAVGSILLYGSETWALRAEDVKRLSLFDD
ncbi:LOW QUALITY PROTEIN: hypothetical protein T265_14651, partial [Opisthorchis viverrini]